MQGEPVKVYNRYRKEIEVESIYGERGLRWTYETTPGSCLNALFLSRRIFSQLFGWYMKRSASRKRIQPFIESYGLDATEFLRPVDSYTSFNDFFRRELRPESRPIDSVPEAVVFPADGRHLAWENLGKEDWIFMKGRKWNLESLLGNNEQLSQKFLGGTLVLSRLCPLDYHHFHYPIGGLASEAVPFKGPLYSVNPVALRRRAQTMWENYRCLTQVRSESAGLVCFLEVGATNVGSIHHCPHSVSVRVAKGERKGWFEFGGSSVISLFEPGRISLSDDLLIQSRRGIELYARMGDRMGLTK